MTETKPITRLQLINGGNDPRPDTRINEQEERVTCHCCMDQDGIDTVEMMPVSTMVVRKGNELKSVITKMICVNCLIKGRKTYLT